MKDDIIGVAVGHFRSADPSSLQPSFRDKHLGRRAFGISEHASSPLEAEGLLGLAVDPEPPHALENAVRIIGFQRKLRSDDDAGIEKTALRARNHLIPLKLVQTALGIEQMDFGDDLINGTETGTSVDPNAPADRARDADQGLSTGKTVLGRVGNERCQRRSAPSLHSPLFAFDERKCRLAEADDHAGHPLIPHQDVAPSSQHAPSHASLTAFDQQTGQLIHTSRLCQVLSRSPQSEVGVGRQRFLEAKNVGKGILKRHAGMIRCPEKPVNATQPESAADGNR